MVNVLCGGPSNILVMKQFNNINEQAHDKTNKIAWAPAKTHIRLHICIVSSEYSLGALRIAKDAKSLHVDTLIGRR